MAQITHKASATVTTTATAVAADWLAIDLESSRNYTKFTFFGHSSITAAKVQVSAVTGTWVDHYITGPAGPALMELQAGAVATTFELLVPSKGNVRILVQSNAGDGADFDTSWAASGSEYSESRSR